MNIRDDIKQNPLKPWRIVLVRLSALGDNTLLVPLLRTLQQRFPNAHITWVIGRAAYALLEGLSGVEFVVIDKPKNLKDYWQLRQRFKTKSYDVLLALQASLRTNLLYPLIKAPLKLGFDKARARDGQRWFVNARIPEAQEHLLDGFLRFADYLGATQHCIKWHLAISEADFKWAEAILPAGAFLVVNPSASKLERTWFIDRYAAVMTKIYTQYQIPIVLTGGSSTQEQQLAAQIMQQVQIPVLNLVGKTNLKQLAAVLSKASVMLTPDSGPAHIAVAMGTPVVGLYAVAPSALSAPYLSKETVIDRFPQAVQTILGKDPATIAWGTRVHNRQAMALIDVDSVMQILAPLVAKVCS